MFREFFKVLFSPTPPPRPIKALQLEVTSRCQLSCVSCPKNILGSQWKFGDLSKDIFYSCIAPWLKDTRHVFFHGWGEPLLHPHLWEFHGVAKQAKCKTGFTTNGLLLDANQCRQIKESGLDLLSISFAGSTPETHNRLRKGSDLEMLKENVRRMVGERRKTFATRPKIMAFYLMMRDNIHELSQFISLADEFGVDEVVATNLEYVPSIELEQQRVFTSGTPLPEVATVLKQAQEEAWRRKSAFRYFPIQAQNNLPVCDAEPQKMVFVNHLGQIYPCVYQGIPVDPPFPRYYEGQQELVYPVQFGQLCANECNPEGSNPLLANESRQSFGAMFQGGVAKPETCQRCYKLWGI